MQKKIPRIHFLETGIRFVAVHLVFFFFLATHIIVGLGDPRTISPHVP